MPTYRTIGHDEIMSGQPLRLVLRDGSHLNIIVTSANPRHDFIAGELTLQGVTPPANTARVSIPLSFILRFESPSPDAREHVKFLPLGTYFRVRTAVVPRMKISATQYIRLDTGRVITIDTALAVGSRVYDWGDIKPLTRKDLTEWNPTLFPPDS